MKTFVSVYEMVTGFFIAAFIMVWVLLFFVALFYRPFKREDESPFLPPPKKPASRGRGSQQDSF